MPLVKLKSDLGKINTNFGSETTTANISDRFNTPGSATELRFTPTPFPISAASGVNYFGDIHTTGFTTGRQHLDPTEFKDHAPTLYLDSKNDFSPIYTNAKTALPFFLKASPILSLTSAYSWPKRVVPGTPVDFPDPASGNVGFGSDIPPNIPDDFTTPTNTYQTQTVYTTPIYESSRLEKLHIQGREDNSGFARAGLSLENYYAQLTKDAGLLGIRNDKVNQPLGFEQPFVVREIGNQWGIDKVQAPNSLGSVAKIGLNLIDQIGGSIYGRDPSVFVDRYIADVVRLTKVANPVLSLFQIKQSELQKRNAFDQVTTTKYGLESLSNITIDNVLDKSARILLDPRIYNPASIYSVPGALHISRLGIFDFAQLRRDTAVGIASYISTKALTLAEKVGTALIKTAVGAVEIGVGAVINKLRGSNVAKQLDILTKPTQKSLGGFIDDVRTKADHYKTKAEAFGKVLATEYGAISKATANQLNINLSSVGVDRINLIPYNETGKEEETDLGPEELDFIPFKFKDAVNNKYIVFRAILSGITDTFSPEYASERYVGRPDSVHVYQGTNREISFTFDVYPKSDQELVTLWEKLNYLAGLTYPSWGSGMTMVAPFTELTIGQMYTDSSGYISALSYTVQDNGTWETTFAKLPKYIQVSCTFVYIGDRLLSSTQKHYEIPWVGENRYDVNSAEVALKTNLLNALSKGESEFASLVGTGKYNTEELNTIFDFNYSE